MLLKLLVPLSQTRWRKVFRDMSKNMSRTVLAIAAIALGLFSFGTVMGAYAILTREINTNYQNTVPESAIIYIDTNVGTIDDGLLKEVESLKGVAISEARRVVFGRILIEENVWQPIKLTIIPDFNAMKLATLTSEIGAWPPADDAVLLERSSNIIYETALFSVGDELTIKSNTGTTGTLRFTGISHDPAQAPGWQDAATYGYITPKALEKIGLSSDLNEIRIKVTPENNSKAQIQTIAKEVEALIVSKGQSVTGTFIREPGVHPHADQMDSLLFLLQVFSLLTLLLAAVLSAITLNAILSRQVREIGIMKSFGATPKQTASMYAIMVLTMSVIALLISTPLAIWSARGFASFVSEILNFNIMSNSIPFWVFALIAAVGIFAPLLAASIPIVRGSRVSVKTALDNTGVDSSKQSNLSRKASTLLSTIGLSRPLLLSLRNTFRQRGRLLLTLSVLALAGGTFMSALLVKEAWQNTITQARAATLFDMNIVFAKPYPKTLVETAIVDIDNIKAIESWGQDEAVYKEANGADGLRFRLSAAPLPSKMVNFPVLKGRWLESSQSTTSNVPKEIVVNHDFNKVTPVKIGEVINLKINGQENGWTVVGIIKEIAPPRNRDGSPAVGYIRLTDYQSLIANTDAVSNLRITFNDASPKVVAQTVSDFETSFEAVEIERTRLFSSDERLQILRDHLVVIVSLLVIMAILTAIVGALALTSTMSLIVMERSKEFGVMRAIGASSLSVLGIVVAEGLFISFLGWLGSLVIAWPLTVAAGDMAGNIFIRTGLDYIIPSYIPLAWLAIALGIGLVSSLLPAIQTVRLSVKDVLAYE